MGLLRFLLAAAVVAEHSTPFFGLSLTGGQLAVRLFFIISGFYMMLILSTKYTAERPHRYWLFISNRFCRIYPTYYVVLALSLLFYAAGSLYLQRPADRLLLWQAAWHHDQNWSLLFVSLSQLTVFGIDAVCVFVYDLAHGVYLPGWSTPVATLAWLPTAGADPSGVVPAWRFLFVPQSWSISIELLFYLMVPWLASWRTRNLLLLGFLSFGFCMSSRFFLAPALFTGLNYFFLPFHLILFILGMLAYRYSGPYLARLGRLFKAGLVSVMFATLLLAQFIPSAARYLICIVLVFVSLPVLFDWSKKSRFQKWVGDLSYPIYICHILVKWGLLGLMGVSTKGVTSPQGWVLLVGSITLAAALLRLVDYPVDKWRQQRVEKARPAPV
jgi:peptidoglycan/LPS O-acetylase OafA/YrhL